VVSSSRLQLVCLEERGNHGHLSTSLPNNLQDRLSLECGIVCVPICVLVCKLLCPLHHHPPPPDPEPAEPTATRFRNGFNLLIQVGNLTDQTISVASGVVLKPRKYYTLDLRSVDRVQAVMNVLKSLQKAGKVIFVGDFESNQGVWNPTPCQVGMVGALPDGSGYLRPNYTYNVVDTLGFVAPSSAQLTHLTARVNTAPGVGFNTTFTLLVNGNDTLWVDLADDATYSQSGDDQGISVMPGDIISVRADAAAGHAATDPLVAFELLM